MQNSQHNGSLKDKFQDFGAAPSEALWGDIANSLDEKKKKRAIIWWWFGGIAATLLLSFSMYKIGFERGADTVQNQIESSDLNEDIVLIDDNQDDIDYENENVDNQNNTNLDSDSLNDSSDNSSFENKKENNEEDPNKVPLIEPTEYLLALSTMNNIQVQALSVEPVVENLENIDFKEYVKINKVPTQIQVKEWNKDSSLLADKEEKEEYKWNLGFNASAMESMDWGVQYDLIQPTTMADVNNSSQLVDNSGVSLESFTSPAPTIVEKWVSPVYSLDFLANKYFSNRFAFSTGGQLSFRQFHTQYDMFDIQFAKSRVFSLGIPVGLKFDMVHRDNFRFYMRGSVLSEMPFIENIKVSNYNSFTKSTNLTLGYMGSGQFDTGIEWRMANGIFLNMNLSYRRYFVQSMKSEHPLAKRNHWLGGSMGLVWEL